MLDDTGNDDDCPCSGASSGHAATPWPGDDGLEPCPAELEPVRVGPGFRVYSLLPRLAFTWGNVDAAGSLEYLSPRYVSLEEVLDADLVVRVHQGGRSPAGYVDVEVQVVSFSADDPATVFVHPRSAAWLRVDANATPGTARVVRLSSDLGSHLRLRLTFVRIGVAPENALTLSVDLVTRWPDETTSPPAHDCKCDAREPEEAPCGAA